MKTITVLLTLFVLTLTNLVTAQSKQITATVVNATSDSGKISFALYDSATYMKVPIQSKNAKISNGKSTVVFKNLPEGEYAVICYHDKNDNDKMDFEPNGMPKEDYGASNNIMNFGPPSYEDAKFIVSDKNVSLDIKF